MNDNCFRSVQIQDSNQLQLLDSSTAAPSSGSCICGKQSLKRIVGGQAAVSGEFPWLAGIRCFLNFTHDFQF